MTTQIPTWTLAPTRPLALDRPRIMAVFNMTPDSFSDGGRYPSIRVVSEAAAQAVADGADILDIGGESTRPGASRVPAEEQIRRVVPAIAAIRALTGPASTIPITIDTTLSAVARAALDAGADAINDVSAATEDPAMLDLAAERRCGLILMHRLLPPDRDSYSDRYTAPPEYRDLVGDVRRYLLERAQAAMARGVARSSIVLDPGLGFGKTVEQNLELVRRTRDLAELGFPILSGASRKSFVGRTASSEPLPPQDRLGPSIAFSVAHYLTGASIFRVHDVAEQTRALRAIAALHPRDPRAG